MVSGGKAFLKTKAQNFVFGKKNVWSSQMILMMIQLFAVASDIEYG
jgi:hypothetical protein